jgi:putative mycofactocin binding protein MftB
MVESAYFLRSTCQVREERFGLLFYNSTGPKLLFAETGSLLTTSFFQTGSGQQQVLNALPPVEKKKIINFLRQLEAKGFLYEQQIC